MKILNNNGYNLDPEGHHFSLMSIRILSHWPLHYGYNCPTHSWSTQQSTHQILLSIIQRAKCCGKCVPTFTELQRKKSTQSDPCYLTWRQHSKEMTCCTEGDWLVAKGLEQTLPLHASHPSMFWVTAHSVIPTEQSNRMAVLDSASAATHSKQRQWKEKSKGHPLFQGLKEQGG